ncbi:MAG: hypoxanthine phosphoribosyltransferase [Dehalococcoidia bacterium]|nr:hypoxanthine phosphoribosyltransferase [Dehalococcoidia bacterium]
MLAGELISAEAIERRVAELARQVRADYDGVDLLLVGVLKAAVTFMVDLARELALPLEMDFMAVSSYGPGTESSGIVRIIKDLDGSIEGRHVLVVEDIVDTGATLRYLLQTLQARGPASLRVCSLLNKRKTRKADVELTYVGFEIPDCFVVGYGLDYEEQYRNMPHIALLADEERPDE